MLLLLFGPATPSGALQVEWTAHYSSAEPGLGVCPGLAGVGDPQRPVGRQFHDLSVVQEAAS